MRNLRKVLLIFSLLCFFMLSGCQADLDKAILIGRYDCESVNGESVEQGVECYVEIIDDENYTLVYNGHGYAFDFPSTYRVEGNKLFLSGFYDGKGNPTEQEALFENDSISYTELQTNYEYVFRK